MHFRLQIASIILLTSLPHVSLRADAPAPISAAEAKDYAKTFKPTGIAETEFQKVRVVKNLQYARYGDQRMLLDMYLPEKVEHAVACVVTVTGGGFRARDKDAFARYSAFLATHGFAAACISYRGTPDDQFPATVYDCKAAVRFVRANADRFNLDPNRIGIFGQSAGGHLAGMLAVSDGVDNLEGDGGNTGVSSRVQAAVSSSGVFDFISRLRDGGHQIKSIETKKRTNGEWVGEPFSVDSELWKRASPITYLSEDDAPLLLLASKTDKVVPFAQSVQMHETMQAKGLVSELSVFDTGGHGVAAAPAINKEVWSITIAFLRKHLQ